MPPPNLNDDPSAVDPDDDFAARAAREAREAREARDDDDLWSQESLRRDGFLNSHRRRQAIHLAETGMPLNAIAEWLGCSYKTIVRERHRDPDFRSALARAQALARADPLEGVRRHAATDWRAAAWLLERTRPEEFAPRRPARLRSAEIDAVCERLTTAAVELTPDFAMRVLLYERLQEVADQLQREHQGGVCLRPRVARQSSRLASLQTVDEADCRPDAPLALLADVKVKVSGPEAKVDSTAVSVGLNNPPQPSTPQGVKTDSDSTP